MKFETALKHLKNGEFMYRTGWDAEQLGRNPHMYFELTIKRGLNYLVYKDDNMMRVHAPITSDDLLATDWEIKLPRNKSHINKTKKA